MAKSRRSAQYWRAKAGRLLAEVHLWQLSRLRGNFPVWMFLEPEHFRGHVGREPPALSVIRLHGLVVTHTGDRQTIFGSRQFILQAHELRVGLQLRVVF